MDDTGIDRDSRQIHISQPLNKRLWHPSPLVHQIVLVTTVSEEGVENVAPKSLISMLSFDPPILVIGCNRHHNTAKNIIATREFVVNIPHRRHVEEVWRSSELPHPRRVSDMGLTAIPGVNVKAPRIKECPAHLECTLDSTKTWGDEMALFGEIVSFTMLEELGHGWEEWYRQLGPFLFLEDKLYGVVKAQRVEA